MKSAQMKLDQMKLAQVKSAQVKSAQVKGEHFLFPWKQEMSSHISDTMTVDLCRGFQAVWRAVAQRGVTRRRSRGPVEGGVREKSCVF